MKRLITLLMLIPLTSVGIEPVIVKLDDTNPSYTVPSDKVLLIEHFFVLEDEPMPMTAILDIVVNGVTNTIALRIGDDYIISPPSSLKIPSSAVLQRGIIDGGFGGQSNSVLILMGLLADSSDLYAYIENEPDNMLVQDGTFSFDVHSATPRPARVIVEGSTDLLTPWQSVDATVEKKAPNSYTVSIPVEDEEKYFAKYTLRGIEP